MKRNSKGCTCARIATDPQHPMRPCKAARCTEWYCERCGRTLFGVGPIGCKCDGYIRELFYPGMMALEHHVPVKPSIARRRNQKRRTRERLTV